MRKDLEQYLETSLWSSNDENGDAFDINYTIDDISDDFKEKSLKDLDLFIEKAGSLLDGLDLTDIAHDFFLTRNNHGAGFWDGNYEESVGTKLTEISKEFPSVYLYVGKNNLIYGD